MVYFQEIILIEQFKHFLPSGYQEGVICPVFILLFQNKIISNFICFTNFI